MPRVPMGNFGNAMPQAQRIQMPQRNTGELANAINNTVQVVAQAKQQNDKVKTDEAKIKLDETLTRDFSDQVTLVKNDVLNGVYDAKAGDDALRKWSSEKYKDLETEMPSNSKKDLQNYWNANVNQQASGLLPLQIKADAQKSVSLADRATDIATRYDRNKGRDYLKSYLDTAQISEAEKSTRMQKYDITRDILDIDDRISVALSKSDPEDLHHLESELDSGEYQYLDGATAQNKKNQVRSRIDSINKTNEVAENKRVQEAGKVLTDFKSQVLTGRMLDDSYRNDVKDSVRGTDHETEFNFYDQQSSNFQNFSRKSTTDQLAVINKQKVNMKNSSTQDAVNEEKVLGVYEDIYKEKLNTIKNNPNQAVREAGLDVNELSGMELKSDPNSFIKKVVENGSNQKALKDSNITVLPISSEDLPDTRNAFEAMGVDQKLNFIGGLIDQSKGIDGGASIWGAVLGQLGSGSMNYVTAGLARKNNFKSTEGRDLATSILTGTQLLKNKQLVMPKEAELKLAFNQYVGNTVSGTSANRDYETFKAVYADTLNERGMQHKATDEDPNVSVLKTALGMTTGGVYTQSGEHKNYLGETISDWKVSKPYGWEDGKFESYINHGYKSLAEHTGKTVNELQSFRLQQSNKRNKKGELQYDLVNERGNPFVIDGVTWRISLPGATK